MIQDAFVSPGCTLRVVVTTTTTTTTSIREEVDGEGHERKANRKHQQSVSVVSIVY